MKRLFLFCFSGMVCCLLMISCCPRNPQLNSVKTAHGNTDWHIDTAEEFLTGKEMGGATTAANHCPNTWTKIHMHVGSTNTNIYYYDRDVTASGQDDDSSNGIDRPMLFFYAGHGGATSFNTLGNSASLGNMRLGNCSGSNDGTLRYYWQCSCEVFAHGPKNCTGVSEYYACPEDFDGSADSSTMRNVYERWGPILSPELRMACGSSTAAYCHETETNKIWDNYNNKGYDVADSFIDGLHRYDWNTPLCITTGRWSVSSTPLFDTTFTNAPNPSGSFLHIQYLSSFDSNMPVLAPLHVPEYLPIYELIPLPLPDPYRKMKFEEEGDWLYSVQKIEGRGPAVRINRKSGAIYTAGKRTFDEKRPPLKEITYTRIVERLIKEQGWAEENISKLRGLKMIIERIPREKNYSAAERFQKNVTITARRQIIIDGRRVEFVGEGGLITFQLNNDATVFNSSKIWRKIKGVKRVTKGKPFDQAYNEALGKIREKEAYRLADWRWGYEELAGNVEQTELMAVYLFNFMPRDPDRTEEYPPRIVKVSAHME